MQSLSTANVANTSRENSAFTPYRQQPLANALGATDHALTDSNAFRKHLDARGEFNAEVYNWHISKLPDDQVVPMDTMEQLVIQLHSDAQTLYQKHGKEWSEDRVRRALVEKVDAFDNMTRTHPRLFYLLTERNTSAEKRMHVLNMIHLKQKHQTENTPLERQQKEISQYMHAMFVRPAAPGEEAAAVANGTGVRGSIVRASAPLK